MSNKKVSPDGTVLCHFYLPPYQKEFLASLGDRQGAAFIRKVLDDVIKNHKVELAKLKEELKNSERQTTIIKAQIEELEKEINKQQDTSIQKEQLLERLTQDLIVALENKGGNFAPIRKIIKDMEPGIKKQLNGNSGNIIEELERRVKDGYISKGEKLYGL